MHNIMIVGAGKIGTSIAKLLHSTGDYRVTVLDGDLDSLNRLTAVQPKIGVVWANASDQDVLKTHLTAHGCQSVLSAGPFSINVGIARVALELGINYFDLTEDRFTTQEIMDIASSAREGQIFMPQCGLAPGFIGILGHSVQSGFDAGSKIDLKMRVGALPHHPSNRLKYNLTWSTIGLVNEYCNPCEAVVDGVVRETVPLEGLEDFVLDGESYEAFNTSGGLGTLCDTLRGRARSMDYKTVRYPGHCTLMRFLIEDMGFRDNRKGLVELLERTVPATEDDVVIASAYAEGMKDGRLHSRQETYKIPAQMMLGEWWTGIQITTASGSCAVVDMHVKGAGGMGLGTGFIRQESVDLGDFLSNRFGSNYLDMDSSYRRIG